MKKIAYFVPVVLIVIGFGVYSFSKTEQTVAHGCETSRIRMYTKPFCSFCARAKELLLGKMVKVCEIDISKTPSLRDEMINKTGRKTVPQVFIEGQHIGGWDDLSSLDAKGELDRILG